MTRGMLFDIQRNSTVDGPGIRTAVFFKGCNLRCAWCHNPEGQEAEPQMLFYSQRCTHCGRCKTVQPSQWAQICPTQARVLCGAEYTVEEVLAEIRKDILFYTASKGGVTFSGGECMLQQDFLTELLCRCKQLGIHTAVDTAGHVPWCVFERILPFTDLFLYDIKTMDPERHREYTGVDNALILSNLRNLSRAGKEIVIRVPVVPGVNARPEDIRAIAAFAKDLGLERIELLPYHGMGAYKSGALGASAVCFQEPGEEDMTVLNAVLVKTVSENKLSGGQPICR